MKSESSMSFIDDVFSMIERLANIVESILPLEGNKCLQLISAIGRSRGRLRQ